MRLFARLFSLSLILLALHPSLRADGLALTLLTPSQPVPAGRTVALEIAALNPGGLDQPFELPGALDGTLTLGAQSTAISLRAVGAFPVSVGAGAFAVRRYELNLPRALDGRAVLEIRRPGNTPLLAVLEITPPRDDLPAPAAGSKGAPAAPSVLDSLVSSAPAASALSRNFAGRFMPNQPIYFIYGDSAQAAKYQFSFDYRLATFPITWGVDRKYASLRFGYTQRSVWDINANSSPFYDTSYMPELSLGTDAPMPATARQAFTWLGWRLGLQHESNGKDGFESRSLNTVYLRPRFVLGTIGSWSCVVLPELFAYVGDVENNPEIADYRGHARLRAYFGHNAGPTLLATAWAGRDFDHPSYQLELAIPTRLKLLSLEYFFYIQYFNGYGESLREFTQHSEALRAGFSLVR